MLVRIEGEIVLRVPSLGVPGAEAPVTADEASRYGAVALFVERANAADRRFTLTNANAATIARICEQLDGIALAIEMAAARVKVLSVEQLAARLEDRFRILTASNRSALPRQQTMRALIDWSYDLLNDNEKTVFRRLSVFAGGCTLDAASAVCSDAAIDALDVLDLLSGLVDKSLIVTELVGAEQRYRLLASTRQYAIELLEKSGEADIVRSRHAEFFRRRWIGPSLAVTTSSLELSWRHRSPFSGPSARSQKKDASDSSPRLLRTAVRHNSRCRQNNSLLSPFWKCRRGDMNLH